ncbi:MAG TPA: hypothetical protein VF074_08340 [Pyrinomonadaceae bacterium]
MKPSRQIIQLQVLFLMLLVVEVCAQDNPQRQPSTAGPIVKMKLIVTDRDNHSIDQFRKEDLKILNDNREQSILSVEKDERPIDYGLVIDSSGSFRSILPIVIPAAKHIINSNRPTDRTFIERFVSSDKIRIVQDLTSDLSRLGISLDRIMTEAGQSAVLDAYKGSFWLRINRTELRRVASVRSKSS